MIWPADIIIEERRKKTQRHSQTGRLEKSSIDLVTKYIGQENRIERNCIEFIVKLAISISILHVVWH